LLLCAKPECACQKPINQRLVRAMLRTGLFALHERKRGAKSIKRLPKSSQASPAWYYYLLFEELDFSILQPAEQNRMLFRFNGFCK